MKKNLLLLGSLCMLSVQAEDGGVRNFDSFYVGGGFGGNFVCNDDMMEHCNLEYTVDMGEANEQNCARKLEDKSVRRATASFVLGAGKTFFNGFYAGMEGNIDFAESKTHGLEIKNSIEGTTTKGIIKNEGLSYNLGVRLGLVNEDTMVYIKPSVLFNKVAIEDYANEYVAGTVSTNKSGSAKKNNAMFAVALGIEKIIGRNFSIRLEGEYSFPTKIKAESQTQREAIIVGVDDSHQYVCEAKVKRASVRLLAVYNIKY